MDLCPKDLIINHYSNLVPARRGTSEPDELKYKLTHK